MLGQLPVQAGTSKGHSHFSLLTLQNSTCISCRFTETQTPPWRLKERGPSEHGSEGLLAAFCLRSMKALHCQDLVTHRPMPKPVHLRAESQRRLQLPSRLTFSSDAILIGFCDYFWGTQPLGDAVTHQKSDSFIFWEAIVINTEMGFISTNPKNHLASALVWLWK